MYQIPTKVDFYITNVCNLTCENCNRFNNHDFKGWQRWSDYQSQYEQWGSLVDLRAITIMGGEPMLNPTIKDWVEGLNRIFGIEVQVLTNGTRFQQNKNLYPSLLYRQSKNHCLNHIGVSLHNVADFEAYMKQDIIDFLEGPVNIYEKNHPLKNWGSDWHFKDKNGVFVNVYISNNFSTATIQQNNYQRFVLHNSDIEQAHKNCAFVQWKSYHFIRGKLYKCGPVALMPEFDQQHKLDISAEDRVLLNSYRPLSIDEFDQRGTDFISHIDDVIPQCKFCPTKFTNQQLIAVSKKRGATTVF